MAYSARILRDSVALHQWPNRQEQGARLTTFEVTFPRIVLAEFNTHRVFSRNSASSRAIPVEKQLKKVMEDPFIPIYWGKNQKGMQAERELLDHEQLQALCEWIVARDYAVEQAERLLEIGVHKQITNRLLEPFMWHTVIVTGTEWDNWWGLRCNKDAQPEIRRIAEMMKEIYDKSSPSVLLEGDWHLPLVDDRPQLEADGYTLVDLIKICIGRCTRVSYLTHDGKRDPKADMELCERLLKSGHMSPFEHAARPMTMSEAESKYGRPGQYIGDNFTPSKQFCGNFRGWIQARKLIQDEDNFLKVIGTDRPFSLRGV